jgi:hypothetical protein
VIATGFNRKIESKIENLRSIPVVAPKAEPRVEAAQAVNLAVPEEAPAQPFGSASRPKRGMPLFEDDSFEVPAFLRKQLEP